MLSRVVKKSDLLYTQNRNYLLAYCGEKDDTKILLMPLAS
jgi:hypothetical protein